MLIDNIFMYSQDPLAFCMFFHNLLRLYTIQALFHILKNKSYRNTSKTNVETVR